MVDGSKVYGVYIAAGDGYRDDSTSGIATGDAAEGEYAVFDGTHTNNGCCFDYGNAETNNNDNGAGHMEAIYFGTEKAWGYGSGNGPWIMADMENGLFSGSSAGYNSGDPTIADRFTTAMIEGKSNQWAILGRNAQSGSLSTFYSGVRPSGYNPMKKQGAIIHPPLQLHRLHRGRRRLLHLGRVQSLVRGHDLVRRRCPQLASTRWLVCAKGRASSALKRKRAGSGADQCDRPRVRTA